MKVCTDACLFGANLNTSGPVQILDVGCGTGLLSLMVAQLNPLAQIDSIEPHDGSFLDAQHNVKESLWAGRIQVHCQTFQQWLPAHQGLYDEVICNPPFFFNHLPSPQKGRNHALHLAENEWENWLTGLVQFLKPEGRLRILLSADAWQKTEPILERVGLFPFYIQTVLQRNEKPFRIMVGLSLTKSIVVNQTTHLLYRENGGLSEWAQGLLQKFYLEK